MRRTSTNCNPCSRSRLPWCFFEAVRFDALSEELWMTRYFQIFFWTSLSFCMRQVSVVDDYNCMKLQSTFSYSAIPPYCKLVRWPQACNTWKTFLACGLKSPALFYWKIGSFFTDFDLYWLSISRVTSAPGLTFANPRAHVGLIWGLKALVCK